MRPIRMASASPPAPPAAGPPDDAFTFEAVTLFTDLGVPRTVAVALVALSSGQERTAQELEGESGLRQPEVSVAMTELRQRGWVAKRDLRANGKGRPRHVYRLSIPIAAIVAHVEREKHDEAARATEALARLRNLIAADPAPAPDVAGFADPEGIDTT